MSRAQTIGATPPLKVGAAALLIPFAIFLSASLVFLVEPLIGRLLLPRLGGAPAVWNTSLVFFQAALLLGYAYAHALQRIRAVRSQAIVHVLVLLAAALVLPLRLSGALGEPPTAAPTAWLLGMLALSLGAPFAALSATAPLLQAWFAARYGERRSPYSLYAASNLGSLAALLGYPLVVEPLLALDLQRTAWSIGYGLFVVTAAIVGLSVAGASRVEPGVVARPAPASVWRQRLWWAALGAIPSSLLLGVTTHISTDVASAPLLWVFPLALYLLTFVLAFGERQWLSPKLVLVAQGLSVAATLAAVPFNADWRALMALHLFTFFFTALMCHQRLAADRPEPARLTEFYLAMSVGGVLGGAFNALLAPTLFDLVWEYPLALILASIARPFGPRRPTWGYLALVGAGLALVAGVFAWPTTVDTALGFKLALGFAAACAFLLRDRAPGFVILLVALSLAAVKASEIHNYERTERGFFGVHRIAYNTVRTLGPTRFLMHGTTMHGAQASDAAQRCRPLTYYTRQGPMGQAMQAQQARGPVTAAVVGLGSGSMAAYVRPGDALTYYEIDPLVADIARTSFSYLSACAKAPVPIVLGDARLTVARAPKGTLDVLVIDAFTSDAVPTHLMTTEAVRVWLDALKPDGVLVMHISNRNLELEGPVTAAMRALGTVPLVQYSQAPKGTPPIAMLSSHVVATSRDPATLARLRSTGPWRAPRRTDIAPWTDDHTDLIGAIVRKL